jgi:hypothetical protein
MKLFDRCKTRFVIWVWNHTPACAEMARLTSRSLEEPLTVGTRLKMRLHFVICAWCRRYFRQIHFLHHSAPGLGSELLDGAGRGMSAEAKQRMIQRIRAGN